MSKETKAKRIVARILRVLYRYFTYFLFVAFVITCSVMLFVTLLERELGIELTGENISFAAKITFWNVLFISLLIMVVETVRRRYMFERPLKQIAKAAEQMMLGDFSVRIPRVSGITTDESFNEMIASINKMAEELEGVETLRSDFIANVSHEMKTPLAVMQNYGKLLQESDLTDEKRLEYAAAVSESCRRLSDMMTNILKLNRLENQQIYPKNEKFDLSEQLCECFLQYESVWESRNIEIETEIEDGVSVTGDSELLYLVWSNLFSNAFKFTDDGGKVALTLRADEKYATVSVRDTGCGMSAEVGAHVFEKFYQGDSSRATQGNGLGLALVKRVVDIVGGEISVESAVGEGSLFTVKIRRFANGILEKAR
ncbi:MAG: HAMP domain-containing histidine kinase [Ruminococcaceae bacterium]|nr:HAMP domain-containing histidine kinase [Oscillospiraceae bacterium]